jgi:cytochrome c biogenesis factor
LGEPATDNLSWLDKPAAPSADNVRGNASTAPATAPTAAASYEVPAPGNAHAAPSAPQAAPAADDHFVIPAPAGDAAGSEPILTPATALSMQKSRYSRMHLLPGLLGWLITISLMDGGLWAIQSWLTLTGQSESIEYASVVSRLFSGASNAVPVAVALSVLIFFAYLVGGYAAGRMARFAGAKQGIAVWLWQIMALILGSLATFLTPQLFQNGVASLSLQKLIAGDFANGLLAVLLVLALSFLGAILGGLLGRLYHRRVDKYPSDQVAREDA